MKSCYIHIPFCMKICSYCDFCKEFYNEKKVKEYLKTLKKEVEKYYKGEVLDTIYIGGGTPSCLSLEELEELFQITDTLKKSDNLEFTIEGNFDSTTEEKLKLYKKHGVNRLSLGIESIHPDNLKFLERNEKKEEIKDKISLMRSIGFQNINVDLMVALPNETLKMVKEDLDFILSLNVEHISVYSLIIEEHTKIRNEKSIEEELEAEMIHLVNKTLKEHGYIHYEISNYAKPGYESRHNKTYWLNEEYYGFGAGASSYQSNIRKANTRSLENYKKGNILEEEILSEEDQVEYEVILNLRLREGIDLKRFEDKYHKKLEDYYDYKSLVEEGFLILEKNHIFIPEEKFYVSNGILVKLLEKKKEL